MKRGDHPVQLVEVRRALRHAHAGQRRIPKHAAFDVVHDVERRADHRVVLAQAVGFRHGHASAIQRGNDAVLAVHGVRRWQQLARRLPAQNVTRAASRQPEGRIGLAALELLDFEISREARDVLAKIALQASHIEAMPLLDRHRADEILVHEPLSPLRCARREYHSRSRPANAARNGEKPHARIPAFFPLPSLR